MPAAFLRPTDAELATASSLQQLSKDLDAHRMMTTTTYREVNCTVLKPNPAHSLGVSIAKTIHEGHMIVTRIAKGGHTDNQTNLKVGDIILAINNVGCTSFTSNGITYEGMSAAQAGQLMKASPYKVTIKARRPTTMTQRTVLMAGDDLRLVEAVVRREYDDQPLGFGLGKNQEGQWIVKKTTKGGLVTQQQSGLRPGYNILSLNGQDTVAMTKETAIAILKENNAITIRAQKRNMAKGSVCKTTVFKTVGVSFGMTLAKDGFDKIYIKNIAHDSLVFHTGFQTGWTLLSINEFETAGKTVKQVKSYLANLDAGNVLLRAMV